MRARHAHHQPAAQPIPAPDRQRLKACRSFAEFYPLYLAEHRQPGTRRLHFIGSTAALACLFLLIFTGNPWWLLAAAVAGYSLAWLGHFAVEHNRPATFSRPLWSLRADWVMYADILRGRLTL